MNRKTNSFSAFKPIALELINVAQVTVKDVQTADYARRLKAMSRHDDTLLLADERRRLIETGRHR
jgi:type II secretory ATPase GspE/PulE/Tfp pilus assembly ATPase PilB-like protein